MFDQHRIHFNELLPYFPYVTAFFVLLWLITKKKKQKSDQACQALRVDRDREMISDMEATLSHLTISITAAMEIKNNYFSRILSGQYDPSEFEAPLLRLSDSVSTIEFSIYQLRILSEKLRTRYAFEYGNEYPEKTDS